jgi:biotin carboxylase
VTIESTATTATIESDQPFTVLCLAGDVKGHRFMRECKHLGCRVLVLTRESLRGEEWPGDAVDDFFYMPSLTNKEHVINAVSYLARSHRIDRILPMDDFDVEIAAALREHLRIPGMGETTSRYFRDKLAMRMAMVENKLESPVFIPVLNRDAISKFLSSVSPPWLLKPRSQAGAAGIKKISTTEEIWSKLEKLGDEQSHHILEEFIPGAIYHLDSISTGHNVLFSRVSKYVQPPLETMQKGGIFSTRIINRNDPDVEIMQKLNSRILKILNFKQGITHTEFIKSQADGKFYFLETAARVGGAYIADMIEAATGINLWAEWARIETLDDAVKYRLPETRDNYAGIVLCLARQEWPDTSEYTDPEVVFRIKKKYHAGLIVCSDSAERVDHLLQKFIPRFVSDFLASGPQPEKIER